MRPRSLYNPYGPNVSYRGNLVKLIPKFNSSVDMEIWYIPNGEISLITGTISAYSSTNATVSFSAATTGTIDLRENAYAGYVINLKDANDGNRIEERTITKSTVDSSGVTTLTVAMDFSVFTPVSGDIYELVPLVFTKRLELAVALYVAVIILSYEENPTRVGLIEVQRQHVMRSLRLEAARYESRVGGHMAKDTPDNRKYGVWGQIWAW